MKIKAKVIDEQAFEKMLTRISHEIIEKVGDTDKLILLGLRTRGEYLANRIHAKIEEIESKSVTIGILDVTLYRDDYHTRIKQPEVSVSNITFDINDKIIVLVDDVLYTGRTIRSALCAVMDYGRPRAIKLAVLVDRGHRELPIKADIVGKNIPTSFNEEVRVRMREHDGEDAIYLVDISQ